MVCCDGSEPETERKVFGAGLKRKRIEFVQAGGPSPATSPIAAPDLTLGERYLSITLKNGFSSASKPDTVVASIARESQEGETECRPEEDAVCGICKLPISAKADEGAVTPPPHEASLAHQVCLETSYPPSYLDRNRHGLKYLSSYGWDPDSRLGLGASGTGIRVPIKAKAKHDTVGLGFQVPEGKQRVGKAVKKLDAKGLRKREAEEKKKRERFQQMFYESDDVNRYLDVG